MFYPTVEVTVVKDITRPKNCGHRLWMSCLAVNDPLGDPNHGGPDGPDAKAVSSNVQGS